MQRNGEASSVKTSPKSSRKPSLISTHSRSTQSNQKDNLVQPSSSIDNSFQAVTYYHDLAAVLVNHHHFMWAFGCYIKMNDNFSSTSSSSSGNSTSQTGISTKILLDQSFTALHSLCKFEHAKRRPIRCEKWNQCFSDSKNETIKTFLSDSSLADYSSAVVSKEKDFVCFPPSPSTSDVVTLHNRVQKLLTCTLCFGIFHDPIVSRCGHTYCSLCLSRSTSPMCCLCGTEIRAISAPSVCVLLARCVTQCFPSFTTLLSTRQAGNAALKEKTYDRAIEIYQQALNQNPSDHLTLSNRSYAHMLLKEYEEAANDANTVISLVPEWSKGHYRKAMALKKLKKEKDAVEAFFVALILDPHNLDLAQELRQFLHETLNFDKLMEMKSVVEQFTSGGDFSVTKTLQTMPSLTLSNSTEPIPCSVDTPPSRKRMSNDNDNNSNKSVQASPHKMCKSFKSSASPQPSESSLICKLPLKEDFDCNLCFQLLWQPVTTPCGHTFCRQCLHRSIDHTPQCPLCKFSLKDYLLNYGYPISLTIDRLLRICWPQEFLERKRIHEEELADLTSSIPVMVCTVAFPGIQCPLHIFEPRYRLMIRRCLESGTRQFGMVQSSNHSFGDVGTIVEIKEARYMADGRCILDTVGGRRFRVLEKAVKDGYMTAKVEYITDKSVEGSTENEALTALASKVYALAEAWFSKQPNPPRSDILSHFGPIPPQETPQPDQCSAGNHSGPLWHWWLANVLPVDSKVKLNLLASVKLDDRLATLQQILGILEKRKSSR